MSRKAITITAIAIVLFIGFWALTSRSSNQTGTSKTETVSQLQDVHGLAVGRKDSSKVYIATHTGLLVMQNDGELRRASEVQDDYMGFSAHPTDANTFYTSGHPHAGGNIGFQKSTDGGKTWQKVSAGANGPVDFHSMTVCQADPSLIYGVYRGQLQRSSDEGKSWDVVNADIGNIITLATNTTNKEMVYAGTTEGLQVSQDRGQTWSRLGLMSDAVTGVAVNPANSQEIAVYSQAEGLLRSIDGGKTWSKTSYTGGMVMHLAYDPQNPAVLYLIGQDLGIYKTSDSGVSWKKVR